MSNFLGQTEETLVSVIMPSFNHGKYILEAIISVLNQTYKNLELIIVDNYSTDNTKEIVSSIQDDRVRFFQFNNNGIIAASRNFGIKQSQGNMIAFLDSDDIWISNKLEKQIILLRDNPHVSMVSSNFEPIDDVAYTNNYLNRQLQNEYRDFTYKDVILSNPIVTSSVLLRRANIEAVGLFDEDPRLVCIEDWDCWLRVIQNSGPVRVLKSRLVYYRVLYRNNRNMAKISQNMLVVLEKNQKTGYLSGILKYQARAQCHLAIGNALMKQPYSMQSIKHYLKAIWFVPGLLNRLQCFLGIFLNCIPVSLRVKVVNILILSRAKI